MITGAEFKKRLEENGLTIADIAEESGTSHSSISQWCSGIRDNIRPATYAKYMDAYEALICVVVPQIEGSVFKQMVLESGIPFSVIARKAGVAQSMMQDWKNGGYNHKLRWSTYNRIMTAFEELKKE